MVAKVYPKILHAIAACSQVIELSDGIKQYSMLPIDVLKIRFWSQLYIGGDGMGASLFAVHNNRLWNVKYRLHD